MNLAAKYHRTELLEDGEIQKWRATNRSTGADVVLYLYTGGLNHRQSPAQFPSSMIEQRLATGHLRVDSGVYGLSPCVICSAQPGVTDSKPEVLPVAIPTPVSPVPALPASGLEPSTDDAEVGEFTALFGAASFGSEEAPRPQSAPAASAPAEPPTPPVPPAPAPEPAPPQGGTFTQMYLAADPNRLGWVGSSNLSRPKQETPAPEPQPTPAPEPAPAQAPERGAFTELFLAADASTLEPQATAPTPAAPEVVPAQPKPVVGTFTELYMAVDPDLAKPAPAEPLAAPAEPLSSPPQQTPTPAAPEPVGTFTELYLAVDPSLAPAPPAAQAPAPFTSPAPQQSKEGPGEFTRMFQPDDFTAEAQPSTPTPTAAASLPGSSPVSPDTSDLGDTIDEFGETMDFAVPSPKQPQSPPAAKTEEPGEFTLMFQPGMLSQESAPRESAANLPAPASPTLDAEPTKPKSPLSSGTFSRTYVSTDEMPVMREDLEAPPAAAPRAVEHAPPADAPGEFTRLFASPTEDADLASPAPPAAPSPAAASLPSAPPAEPAAPEPLMDTMPLVDLKPSPETKPAPQGNEPGEFTKFFQPGELEQVRQEVLARKAEATPQPASPAPPAAPAPTAKEAPGEFTMMFSAAELAQEAATAAPASAPSAEPVPSDQPGEFTQMFRSADMGLPTPGEAPAPAFPASSSPMEPEFLTPPSTPPSLGSPAPAAASGSSASGPTFTEYFRAADASALPDLGSTQPGSGPGTAPSGPTPLPEPAPAPFGGPAPSDAAPGYAAGFGGSGATQFFQTPSSAPEPQAPIAPVEQVGPGEYTRMISGEDLRLAMEQGPGGSPAAGGAPAAGAPGAAPGMGMSIPGVSGPRVTGPYVQGPNISTSGITPPNVVAPTMQGPHMSTPQVHGPHMSAPHMSGPSMSGSGFTGPSMSGPQMSGPSVSGAGMSSPPMQVPPMGAAPPTAPPAEAPMPAGAPPVAGGAPANKLIIFATVIVTIIAVSLVLLVLYFSLSGKS